MSAEQRIRELKLELRPPSAPVANYVNAVRTGNLLFLAGKGSRGAKGKVGREVTVEQAYQHAREVGVDLLAVMRAELGSLDKVRRVVKVLGMVNAVPEFEDQPLPDLEPKRDDQTADKKDDQKLPPKPRPRVSLKPKGGTGSSVGDDVPGGGATSSESSKGGTPGTPSGSFTGPPSKP